MKASKVKWRGLQKFKNKKLPKGINPCGANNIESAPPLSNLSPNASPNATELLLLLLDLGYFQSIFCLDKSSRIDLVSIRVL